MSTPQDVLSRLFDGDCFDVRVSYSSHDRLVRDPMMFGLNPYSAPGMVEVLVEFTCLRQTLPIDAAGSVKIADCQVETLSPKLNSYRCKALLLHGPETQEILRSLCGDS